VVEATKPPEPSRKRGVQQRAEVQAFQERLKRAVEITPDTQHEFAAVAQAVGISLTAARRLLWVVRKSGSTPSVATLGRVTPEAGKRAGGLLEILDENPTRVNRHGQRKTALDLEAIRKA
jgi:hypothetical protein